MRKLILLSLIFLAILLNTSCWDKAEIENRAYISAIGIDDVEDSPNILVTYEYPNLGAAGRDGGGGTPRFTTSMEGPTLSDISRGIAGRMDKEIFFRHLKLVVIGEDIAKDSVKMSAVFKALDRSPDVGRRIVFLVAEGKAKDVIETEVEEQPVLGRYMAELTQGQRVGKGYYLEHIGEILQELRSVGKSFVIGNISAKEGEIELKGSSVIKDRKAIGKLDDGDTNALLILNGELTEGKATIVAEDGKYLLTYIATEFEIEKKLEVVDGEIKFTYDIKNEGYIEEYMDPETVSTDTDIADVKKLEEIGDKICKRFEETGEHLIDRIQNDFNADVLKINDYIMKRDPELWNEVKDNWEEVFPKIDITMNMETKIRRVGLTE